MLIKQNLKSTQAPSRVNMFAAAVLTVGLVFSAVPANAYIPRDNQISIRVNPVELETAAGIQRVYEYMTREAHDACSTSGQIGLSAKRMAEKCAVDLLDDFVADLNDKRLIDFHKQQISA